MRKNFIWASLVMILGTFSSFSALSYDGKIKFTGQIIENGCTVDTGAAGKDITVDFGTLSKNVFQNNLGEITTNMVGKSKNFTINLSSCSVAGNLGILFTGTPDNDNRDFYASGVDGVGIKIHKGDNTAIAPGINVADIATIKSNKAAMNFVAELVATKTTIAAHSINKSINFTIIYP
ncbi:fimbrial-like adhesin protein SfmF [Photorhabdus australis subsp. thailandensis]|uniref:Fimbrial-like adhesin protein SfmF n=1 Tax=Photorhabdus australis subsp. thailandensis TaxID=2805096 RepID=A0A1C0U117_9GAMM|nr:fimbrial protein [Photorhabdus australis]OCQ51556.1 fimbrial-like adhesin protein SfmF [Photorhabdus australis subsp. thailandensis]